MIYWQNLRCPGFVMYSDFEKVMEVMGHHEIYPQYHFQNFRELDSTSIRILNSIQAHIDTQELPLDEFMENIIEVKKFKTKENETREVICLPVHTLFLYLYEQRIIADSFLHEPFREFMCFNKHLSNLVPIEKLEHIL